MLQAVCARCLDSYEKKFGAEAFRADEWERDFERLWELEPGSPKALERDYIDAYGNVEATAGPRAHDAWAEILRCRVQRDAR